MASPSKNQNYAYLSRLSTQKLLELLAAAPAPQKQPDGQSLYRRNCGGGLRERRETSDRASTRPRAGMGGVSAVL